MAALCVPTSATAVPVFTCSIQPFVYHVGDSSFDNHSTYAYHASGTTVLTGGACPFDGLVIAIREAAVLHDPFGFFGPVTGPYGVEADPTSDGHGGVAASGVVTLFGAGSGFGTYTQVVNVERGGVHFQLEQLATIDLFAAHHPLISLETVWGEITFEADADGNPVIPLPW